MYETACLSLLLRLARCVTDRQNISRVGFNAVENPIRKIGERDHSDARPLRNLWRAEREFSNALLDRRQAPLEGRS
jgi:hypothetical protein